MSNSTVASVNQQCNGLLSKSPSSHGSAHTLPHSSTLFEAGRRFSFGHAADEAYTLNYQGAASPIIEESSASTVDHTASKYRNNLSHINSLIPSLSARIRWSYGVGHVLNDLTASCWFSYLLVFLRTCLVFSSTSAGLLLMIGQFADGCATPITGLLSDATKTKFGKRRLWIGLGSLCVALTFPFIFAKEVIPISAEHHVVRVLYYSFFIILFQFAWASVQVNHLALVPELTHLTHERVFLNSLRSMFTILSNLTVFCLAWFLIESHAGTQETDSVNGNDETSSGLGPTDVHLFTLLALIVVGLGSLFSLLFIFLTPEPKPRRKKQNHRHMKWYHWFLKPLFYQTALLYTCTRLTVNMSQTFMPLYLLVSLQAPKTTIATIPLVVFGAGLTSTLLCDKLTKRLGSAVLTLVGCVCVLVSCGLILCLTEWHFIYLIATILGCGTGIVGVSALSLICNLVGDSCESGAFVYGAMSFSDKVANGAVIMAIEALAPSASTAATSDSVKSLQQAYYRDAMVYVPGAAALFACIMLLLLLLLCKHHVQEHDQHGVNQVDSSVSYRSGSSLAIDSQVLSIDVNNQTANMHTPLLSKTDGLEDSCTFSNNSSRARDDSEA